MGHCDLTSDCGPCAQARPCPGTTTACYHRFCAHHLCGLASDIPRVTPVACGKTRQERPLRPASVHRILVGCDVATVAVPNTHPLRVRAQARPCLCMAPLCLPSFSGTVGEGALVEPGQWQCTACPVPGMCCLCGLWGVLLMLDAPPFLRWDTPIPGPFQVLFWVGLAERIESVAPFSLYRVGAPDRARPFFFFAV